MAVFPLVYVHSAGSAAAGGFCGGKHTIRGHIILKSYVGVCLEGAVIVLACVIYSAFVSTPTVASGEATTIVWSYLAETVFNMLVLVGLCLCGQPCTCYTLRQTYCRHPPKAAHTQVPAEWQSA